jgi:hypothetical protein
MRREFGWPLAELGNIRLRKGDLVGAEEAFVAAHEHVWCPHPGLALVRLAQGEVDAAAELIDDAIAHPFLSPSKERPPSSDLTLAPLLEAQVEIAVAAGDLDTARRAATSLRSIGDTYASPWLHASSGLAAARISLAEGDADAAARSATGAVADWADIGAPYETAVARMVLADAHAMAGRDASARLEWSAAARAFEEFGAARAAADAQARLVDPDRSDGREGAVPGPGGTATEAAVEPATFRLEGDTRHISFAGQDVTLRDLKGFRYLARLLADPGRELHVLDLVAVEQGTLPTGAPATVGEAELEVSHGQGIAAIDEAARDAYRRRLADVEDDLDDAHRCNDPARAELAERDREYLMAELARAVGLGGRLRQVGSDAERARTAVARTLRYAIARLHEHHPPLAAHLESSVRTGTYCSYRPEPRARVEWAF